MTSIEEEISNLKKIMRHITNIYLKKTKIDKKEIKEILKKDINWNIRECIKFGLIDEEFKN
jgi:ATP-dependent protease ClpP protease subunit